MGLPLFKALLLVFFFGSIPGAEASPRSCSSSNKKSLQIYFEAKATGKLTIKRQKNSCRSSSRHFTLTQSKKIRITGLPAEKVKITYQPKSCGAQIVRNISLHSKKFPQVRIKNALNDACPTLQAPPLPTATPIATPTIILNPQSNILKCPAFGELRLAPVRFDIPSSVELHCKVLIPAGATFHITEPAQITFNDSVTFDQIETADARQIFHSSLPAWVGSLKKWWYTPVKFKKPQTLTPEWFGAKLSCNGIASDPCFVVDSSEAFQITVNSLSSGLPSLITTFQSYQPPFLAKDYKFFRFLNDVTIVKDNVSIDLRQHYIHSPRGVRFIINGDINRSDDINDVSDRAALYLQKQFPNNIDARHDHALHSVSLKNINFGVPKESSANFKDSLNKAGIGTITWGRDIKINNITRVGAGGSGLNVRVCTDCAVDAVNVFGSSEGNFLYEPLQNRFRWIDNTIGILLLLSNNTHVSNSVVSDGAYFAGIQVKGGTHNTISNSRIKNLRVPVLTTHKCIHPVTNAVSYLPLNKDCNENPIKDATIFYSIMTAFWDRGDAPYKPSLTAGEATMPSYPYPNHSFAEPDFMRASRHTEFRNLSVENAPTYSAYRSEESFGTMYYGISATNVLRGLWTIRNQIKTPVTTERGHIVEGFNFSNIMNEGILAQIVSIHADAPYDESALLSADSGQITHSNPALSTAVCLKSLPSTLLSTSNIQCN